MLVHVVLYYAYVGCVAVYAFVFVYRTVCACVSCVSCVRVCDSV